MYIYIYIVITKFVGNDQIDHCPNFQGFQLFFVGQFLLQGPSQRSNVKRVFEKNNRVPADFGVDQVIGWYQVTKSWLKHGLEAIKGAGPSSGGWF